MVKNWLPQRYKVVLMPNFRKTREDVLSYASENWWENSVRNFRDILVRKLNNLQIFPNGYPRYQDTPYRRILVWDFIVLFRVDVDSDQVIVFGIYHSSQNLSEIVGDLE